MSDLQFLRRPEALKRLSRGRSAFYSDIKQGLITKPVKLGARASAWPLHEIEAIQSARLAGATEDKLRELVNRLHEERQAHGAQALRQLGTQASKAR